MAKQQIEERKPRARKKLGRHTKHSKTKQKKYKGQGR